MRITPELFSAFLRCPTKCWLKSTGEHGTGNVYAEWVDEQNESYRAAGIDRLRSIRPPGECATSPPSDGFKEAKWGLAIDVLAQKENLESHLHALERIPSEGRGKAAQFVPMRFIYRNKVTQNDKLLVAFDALVLSESVGRGAEMGKIIHGDIHSTLNVKVSGLVGQVRKAKDKITALLASASPPDLILNQHCPECEFRDRCRQRAIEKDDLSLLSNMPERDRQAWREKGIFTVTQLSYNFRPRRRPKKLAGKRERYHHSLKALALRERKIYVIGSPELKVEGTPVYLDVEGIPDRDFYYLIGARVAESAGSVHYTFWADNAGSEQAMWIDFVRLLSRLGKPTLIHYGSFETAFLKRMCTRYPLSPNEPGIQRALDQAINLVSTIFAQIYFPTLSNGLKDIAGFLGFKWSSKGASGTQSVVWRMGWEQSQDPVIKEILTKYNADDCAALEITAQMIARLPTRLPQDRQHGAVQDDIVHVDALKAPFASKWRIFSSPIQDLEVVNKAAHWDYQRDRIYVRSSKRVARARRTERKRVGASRRVDKTIQLTTSKQCPDCSRKGIEKGPVRSVTQQEILFGRFSLKRRVVRYRCQPFWCPKCEKVFGVDERFGQRGQPPRYGRSFLAYLFYQVVGLQIPVRKVADHLSRLLGITLNPGSFASFKETLAGYYSET
jgi:predicted RecB family nuclease